MALNLSKRMDCAKIPWEDRLGESFSGLSIPFGAKVLFWNNPKENVTNASKFAPKGEDGISGTTFNRASFGDRNTL